MRLKHLAALFLLPLPLFSQALRPASTREGVLEAFQVPGSIATYPLAISDSNIITGSWKDSAGLIHGFVRQADGTLATFDVPGGLTTEPTSVNSNGDVAGIYVLANTTILPTYFPWVPYGFVRTADGAITTIQNTARAYGNLPWTEPLAITDSGEVIGSMLSVALGSTVASWSSQGSLLGIYSLTAASYSTTITGVASNGAETGSWLPGSSSQQQGFVWNGQGSTPDPDAPTSAWTSFNIANGATFPSGVNAQGTVVGSYATAQGTPASYFIRDPSGNYETFNPPAGTTGGCGPDFFTTNALAFRTPALSINDSGSIIGCYTDPAGNYGGFLRLESGTMVTLTNPGSQMTMPTAINNQGIITGSYSAGSAVVGFIYKQPEW
jgi:hypothetical protein